MIEALGMIEQKDADLDATTVNNADANDVSTSRQHSAVQQMSGRIQLLGDRNEERIHISPPTDNHNDGHGEEEAERRNSFPDSHMNNKNQTLQTTNSPRKVSLKQQKIATIYQVPQTRLQATNPNDKSRRLSTPSNGRKLSVDPSAAKNRAILAAHSKEARRLRRLAMQKAFDAEKLKANIYRDYVGRRDAFDLGKGQQKSRRQNAKMASAKKETTMAGSKATHPNIVIEVPLTTLPDIRSPDKSMAEKAILRLEGMPKRTIKNGLSMNATMGLTSDQIKAFREVFDLFDSNGGGTIDAAELDETLRSVSICLTREEIEEVLNMIDNDGNGEIDFAEFLHLMTNTERFLESLADNQMEDVNKNVKEHLLFEALTEFMKKSALHSMDEIVGYFHTKYKRVQTPHVVNHYAAGARLIGLNEKQLKQHLEKLKATNTDTNSLKSPYAQPLHIVASTTNVDLMANQAAKKCMSPKRGFIRLKVKLQLNGPGSDPDENEDVAKENEHGKLDRTDVLAVHPQRISQHGWMSQRTEHIEAKLPPMLLTDLMPFDALTAEDLPQIRSHVTKAADEYRRQRVTNQKQYNMRLWKTLDAECISPPLLRNHFRVVFSNYSAIEQTYLL